MPWNYTAAPADGATGWGSWLRSLLAGLNTWLDNLETIVAGKASSSHTHAASAISDSTATGRALVTAVDAAAARAAIGAGTGSGSGTTTAAGITDSTTVGRAVITATDAAAARTAIGAGTSSLAIGTTASTAKAGNYQPTAANISDSTTTGRAVLTAASAAAARTALSALGSGNDSVSGVEFYANEAALPTTGQAGVLYIVAGA